ncbi:hypothetical protein AVEN_93221-1 [Araneus ventricosus]|uniref:Uncharacterized protein n=1 Tax=Araneus ventricosus TaxID=182803 RepID=A0A4Y2W8H9_ARAVE|nr:hypothetical protein AVEN_93221-1 [Araneus ventricosus]
MLNQVTCGYKQTKRDHPHQHAQSCDAKVYRSGIDERECSNEGSTSYWKTKSLESPASSGNNTTATYPGNLHQSQSSHRRNTVHTPLYQSGRY